jgi:hypothetical protein
MNNLHRFIKLPFIVHRPHQFDTIKLPDLPNRGLTIRIEEDVIDKRIIEWLESYGVTASKFYEASNTIPGGAVCVHHDTDELSDLTKFIIAWGPPNSGTRWWKPKKDAIPRRFTYWEKGIEIEKLIHGGYESELDKIGNKIVTDTYLGYEPEQCDVIYEKVLTYPSLINAGQLHSTYNYGNEDRWAISLTLLKDKNHLQFEEALKIFKDVVYE